MVGCDEGITVGDPLGKPDGDVVLLSANARCEVSNKASSQITRLKINNEANDAQINESNFIHYLFWGLALAKKFWIGEC